MAQQPIHACRSRSDLRSTSGQRALSLLRRCVSADARAADGSFSSPTTTAPAPASQEVQFSVSVAVVVARPLRDERSPVRRAGDGVAAAVGGAGEDAGRWVPSIRALSAL